MGNIRRVGTADVLTRGDLDAFERRMLLRFDGLITRFETLIEETHAASGERSFNEAMRAQRDLIRAQTRILITANVVAGLLAILIGFGAAKLA
jgi:hypothetical protein